MAAKTPQTADKRPPKPYPTFPLFAHAKGYWAKKVGGKQKSFGPWEWPDKEAHKQAWKAALKRYEKYREDVARGNSIEAEPELLTLKELTNAYLTYREDRVGEHTKAKTFAELREIIVDFRNAMGADTTIEELEEDVKALTDWISGVESQYGFNRHNKIISRVSGMFLWAEDPLTGILGRPFRLRGLFKQKAERLGRKEKRTRERERGKQRWTADELQAFFLFSGFPLRAMLKLGYFGAFGNTDCSELPDDVMDFNPDPALGLPEGWAVLDWFRPKNFLQRAAVFPPDVVQDVQQAMTMRPKPAEDRYKSLVFRTRSRSTPGYPWVRDLVHRNADGQILKTTTIDGIAQEFRKLRDRLGKCKEHGWFSGGEFKGRGRRTDKRSESKAKNRPHPPAACPVCGGELTRMRKLGFYSFRHTASTYAAGAVGDTALDLFEGRIIKGSRRHYIEEAEAENLKLIADRLIRKLSPVIRSSALPPASPAGVAGQPTAA